jgi:hypothetical protein
MSSSVELAASIDIRLGKLDDRLDALGKLLARPHLFSKILPASVAVAAQTTPALLDFGGCPDGSVWDVELLGFFFTDPWTAAANVSAAVFIGQPPISGVGAVRPADCVIPNLAIPGSSTYGSKRPMVRNKQHLYALISGTGINALTGTLYGTAVVTIAPEDQKGETLTWL